MKKHQLFEYQNRIDYDASMEGLEDFLDEIWAAREKSAFYAENADKKIQAQRFIQFFHQKKQLKSNKYVGVIHYNGNKINLLPKIFYDGNKTYQDSDFQQMQNHMLWWLSYCRRIKFPSYQSALSNKKSDFFEVLIYLFAKYTRQLLNSTIYQQYEEVNKELPFIKGRLDTNTYIQQNLASGRWHKLNCSFDAFVFDNQFNRIIKYVADMLFKVSENKENKKYLREILFILDEVSDEPATAQQCAGIQFNPMFAAFETVRDYCLLFLSNSISFDYKKELKLFAFLLPMEYVFEDFIYGFIDKEIPEIKAKAQKSNTYLDTQNTFQLRPDLYLQTSKGAIIADTKYKIVYTDDQDPKKGISQNDLYQMLAYAVRFKIQHILLFYPSTLSNYQQSIANFEIEDNFAGQSIHIHAHQLPIINHQLFDSAAATQTLQLQALFAATTEALKNAINEVANNLYKFSVI